MGAKPVAQRESQGFEFCFGIGGHVDATFTLPVEALANLRRWLELHGVEPTEEAQSLVVEALLLQLSNGSIDEATRFHFGEFTQVVPSIKLPENYWEREL